MFQKIALVVFISALSMAQVNADDAVPKPTPVQRKLREIDLSIALKQYESLETQLAETTVKKHLLSVEPGLTDAERKGKISALEQRADILRQLAEDCRMKALQIEESNREKSSVATGK